MSTLDTRQGGIDRRSVLKATGLALAGGVLASGAAAAHGGEGSSGPEGDFGARAYTERAHGRLSAVGVRVPRERALGVADRARGEPPRTAAW